VTEHSFIKTLQSDQGINRVYPNEFTVPKALASLIPKEICLKNLLVPLKKADARLIVAMVDPTDYMKLDDLRFITGIPIQPAIATQKEITEKIQELYGDNGFLESALSELDSTDPDEGIEIIIDEEVFRIDGEFKRMIHQDATETEIMEALRWSGMTTLLEDALSKVRSGLTTLEEVLRVMGAQNSGEINCPHCNVNLEERYRFCPFCGGTVTPRCERCGKLLASNWKCCPNCGEKQYS